MWQRMLRGATCIVGGQSKTPFPSCSTSQTWAHLLGRGLPRHCNLPKLHWRAKNSTCSQLWPCWPVQVVFRRCCRACGSRQHTGCSSLRMRKLLIVHDFSKHSRNGRKARTCAPGHSGAELPRELAIRGAPRGILRAQSAARYACLHARSRSQE